ncbi:MAG: AGE family epimerase/isomerase [Phycisphaeraceae bacterium]|nr:AGE family epimerase/isomerase [Phycisphaeraceae bacterium]
MLYADGEYQQLLSCYRDGLLQDVLPFWIRHAIDRECGGFLHCLDRDGAVLDTDKSIWIQGRFTWLLATLYNTVEKNPQWLELAEHGIRFLEKHGFDSDGRMFFTVTREGKPLRKRRYVFSEAFASMAFAAYAKATGDAKAADRARQLHRLFVKCMTEPGHLEPKIIPSTRSMQSIGASMMGIAVAQCLRENFGDTDVNADIDRWLDRLERYFVKHDLKVVMENVGPEGEILDHFDGRILNPGHAIETGWFVLHEARNRGGDPKLIELGTAMIDYMWRRGWDGEHGGILYFRDVYEKPVQEYWQDMKFWWPHTDTTAALLTAYVVTGDAKFKQWHRMVHDWAHQHFPDPEHGEWFGYLHRDGRLSVPLKGNMWKGPFHLPRMQLYCWQLLEKCRNQKAPKLA